MGYDDPFPVCIDDADNHAFYTLRGQARYLIPHSTIALVLFVTCHHLLAHRPSSSSCNEPICQLLSCQWLSFSEQARRVGVTVSTVVEKGAMMTEKMTRLRQHQRLAEPLLPQTIPRHLSECPSCHSPRLLDQSSCKLPFIWLAPAVMPLRL